MNIISMPKTWYKMWEYQESDVFLNRMLKREKKMIDSKEIKTYVDNKDKAMIFEHRKSGRCFKVMGMNPGFLVIGMEAEGVVNGGKDMRYKIAFEKEFDSEALVGEFVEDMISTASWGK